MIRIARLGRSAVLTCGLISVPFTGIVSAQDAPATPEATQPDADKELKTLVETVWHFGKVARYDLAKEAGEQILAKYADKPADVLKAFQAAAKERGDNLDVWLVRWQGVEAFRDTASKLTQLLEQGRRTYVSDTTVIEQNIQRLGTDRGYALALPRLRDSGELAVERMLDMLRKPGNDTLRAPIRRALRDLGRLSLNPLVAATQANDTNLQITVADVLGELGYDAAVPYLAWLATNENAQVKAAATTALARLNAGADVNPAQRFYQLAEQLYYDTSSLSADTRQPEAIIWYWDNEKGLVRKNVPQEIFNELMAMRAAEYALVLDPNHGEALSLWLAANFKREAELPAGATDATRAENQPAAHYYAVQAGTQYVDAVLARAQKDANAAVALKAIHALKEIAGPGNLLGSNSEGPVTQALKFGDRLVRINAAETIAATFPTKDFNGQDRVIPILAEAVAQTGQSSVLLVAESQDEINTWVEQLKAAGVNAAGATTADGAVAAATNLPGVDVVIVSEKIGAGEIDKLFATMAASPRLDGAARLVITATPGSPYATAAATNTQLNVTQRTDAAGVAEDAAKAMKRAGRTALDAQQATEIALRATALLKQLAVTPTVLKVSEALPQLLLSLNDARPELVKAAGDVLGRVDGEGVQSALFTKAIADGVEDDVRISIYASLATNAKFFGNKLSADEVTKLQEAAEQIQSLEVRNAAAEAAGALNLPPDKARTLIVNQSRR